MIAGRLLRKGEKAPCLDMESCVTRRFNFAFGENLVLLA